MYKWELLTTNKILKNGRKDSEKNQYSYFHPFLRLTRPDPTRPRRSLKAYKSASILDTNMLLCNNLDLNLKIIVSKFGIDISYCLASASLKFRQFRQFLLS